MLEQCSNLNNRSLFGMKMGKERDGDVRNGHDVVTGMKAK